MENKRIYNMTFKTITGRNLMEFTFPDEEEIIVYQLEMLANNHINGLLASEAIRVDGEVRLSFDITSLIPLKKLFERREIGKNDFIHILRQIITVIEGLDEYLLDSGGIIFDSQLIFINPQDLHMAFAYLPVKEMPRNLEALKNLVLGSIINDIRFINEPSDNYVQKLIELLKANELDINTFKNYIRSMETKPMTVTSLATIEIPAPISIIPSNKEIIEKRTAMDRPQETDSHKTTKAIPTVKETAKATKTGYPAKSYILLGSVLGAFVLFGIVLSFTETFSIDNPDFLLSLFGYLMIGGALTYLVYSKLFTPDKRIEKKAEIKCISELTPAKPMEYVNKAFTVPRFDTFRAKAEAAPAAIIEDRTEILDVKSLKHPSLKGLNENITETILITRFPFMLGRLEGQVDYCLKNPAVGKMHAEIKKVSEGFLIIDMNSRNGTLLNGERLEPSRDYKLEDGAHVTFANEKFIFYEGKEADC